MPDSRYKKTLFFPHFSVTVLANDRALFDLCMRHFPARCQREGASQPRAQKLSITVQCIKTSYRNIPRHERDCFHGFTIFYNRFAETKKAPYPRNRVIYDVGPRTLRTIIDPLSRTITSYIATPPDIEEDLLFDLIFFQPLKYLLQTRGVYLLHASCVAYKGNAVLFSGKSGSGKSTLALLCFTNGFDYISDDETCLFFDAKRLSIQCAHFPSKPKVRKKLLPLFPGVKAANDAHCMKDDKVIAEVPLLRQALLTRKILPAVLIFPRFVRTARTRIEPMRATTVLNRLLREEFSYIKYQANIFYKEHFKVLGQLSRQVKAYRLHYRDEDLGRIPSMIRSVLH